MSNKTPEPNPVISTIVVVGLAIAILGGWISLMINSRKQPEPVASESPKAKACVSAAGNITDGAVLYSDDRCKESIGTVAGVGKTPGGTKTVFVNANGKTQQISREEVKRWFVMD